MRPLFGTLPYTVRGVPVSMEWMMPLPYSMLCTTRRRPSGFSSRWRRLSHPSIWRSHLRGYSSRGMPNSSSRSGLSRLMNHGTYSLKCSLDSVTKYPSRRNIS